MFEGWLRGDILAFVNDVLDLAILMLLCVWFVTDRCNFYIRKDKG
jgi:hypothetical protein